MATFLAPLDDWKTFTDIASNLVTIAAVAIGAFWAYWRFIRERARWPRAELELVLTHRVLTAARTLLNASVKVHNAGLSLMPVTCARIDVYRITPLSEEEGKMVDSDALMDKDQGRVTWECIDTVTKTWAGPNSFEIEPRENDQFRQDFFIPNDVETVFVYAYIRNDKKSTGSSTELGWHVTAFYDLAEAAGERRASNVALGGGQMSDKRIEQQRPEPKPSEKQQQPLAPPKPQQPPEPPPGEKPPKEPEK